MNDNGVGTPMVVVVTGGDTDTDVAIGWLDVEEVEEDVIEVPDVPATADVFVVLLIFVAVLVVI